MEKQNNDRIKYLPNQKVSYKIKQSPKWQRDCVDYFTSASGSDWHKRKPRDEMKQLYDFYNSYVDDREIKRHLDPLNVDRESGLTDGERDMFSFYDILEQPFNTLYGEFIKREFEVRAYAVNPDVVNEKDRQFRQEAYQVFAQFAQQESVDEQKLKVKLEELDTLLKNDLQTAHEVLANSILKSLQSDTSFKAKYTFLRGFENLQIVGETLFKVENIGSDLVLRHVDSSNFTVLGLTDESNWVEDGIAWVERRYLTPYQIIKEFGQELTEHEIRRILSEDEGIIYNPLLPFENNVKRTVEEIPYLIVPTEALDKDGYLITDANELVSHNSSQKSGTISVTHVEWITLKKIGQLTYLDEMGNQQKMWVPEEYEVLEELGEEVEWIWVQEIMEGTLIGDDIYKRVRPLPVQMRRLSNPFVVRPTYVGYINSRGKGKARSRLDRLVPYQRLFNIWMNKLIELWTNNLGKLGVIDMSRIPSKMETSEWYVWLKRFKLVFENSFEFGKEGVAKGQLAGNMQPGNRTIDLSLAEEINQAITMLSWIEEKVNKIAAVPAPRQGNLSGNEGLGVTQQAIIQATHQTEFDFYIMDLVETKAYEILLEYAKVLWKDEKVKKQFLLDDLSTYLLEIDGVLLNEAEYGIKLTNSSKMHDLTQAMNNLAYPAMQSGIATLTDVASIILSTTPSEIHTKLKQAEDKRNKQMAEQQQQQAELQQQQMQSMMELEQQKHQFEMEKIKVEYGYKLEIEKIKAQSQYLFHELDQNNNGVEDQVELDKEKIKQETEKLKLASNEKLAREKMKNDLVIAKQRAIKPISKK